MKVGAGRQEAVGEAKQEVVPMEVTVAVASLAVASMAKGEVAGHSPT